MSASSASGFTDPAQRVLYFAQEEAALRGARIIGSEHLLLGLLREKESVATRVVLNLGSRPEQVRAALEFVIERKEPIAKSEQESFSERASQIMKLALDEANAAGQVRVGTDHILLAILREGESLAAGVLESLGIGLDRARAELSRLANDSGVLIGSGAASEMGQSRTGRRSVVEEFGINLTELARAGRLDPIVGRADEIERVIQILSRRTKNNPLLIGEPGVGKTAIAEGLAQALLLDDAPANLRNKRLVALDLGSIIAGTSLRGQFEERIKDIITELTERADTIVFIDELHAIIGAGSRSGTLDASNMLKPALSRGDFQIMGATTAREYSRYIENDAALARRFQPVAVEEPSQADALAIVEAVRPHYVSHHQVDISDEALRAAVELSARYLPDRRLPDKAIDLLDEAAARQSVRRNTPPPRLRDARKASRALAEARERLRQGPELVDALAIAHKADEIEADLAASEATWRESQVNDRAIVRADDIAEVVAAWTGVPLAHLTADDRLRLMNVEQALHERIIGQNEAVRQLSNALRRSRAGLSDPHRPLGSFLFLGPTGVGKSELAKALAEFMFGSSDALLQLDMSEYMEKHAVSRLVGAPPGYVGHDDGGQLTEAVRRRPYQVILLDELEKAHPDAFNILLQVLDEGVLTDSQGRRADFRNTIIIMTSNLGAPDSGRVKGRLGFRGIDENARDRAAQEAMRERIESALKNTFRPEFLNRIDATVVFDPLTREQLEQIVELLLRRPIEQLREREIELVISPAARNQIIEAGYDPQYGARPMRRAIQSLFEDGLADGLLTGHYSPGDTILVDVGAEGLTFMIQPQKQRLVVVPPPTEPIPANGV